MIASINHEWEKSMKVEKTAKLAASGHKRLSRVFPKGNWVSALSSNCFTWRPTTIWVFIRVMAKFAKVCSFKFSEMWVEFVMEKINFWNKYELYFKALHISVFNQVNNHPHLKILDLVSIVNKLPMTYCSFNDFCCLQNFITNRNILNHGANRGNIIYSLQLQALSVPF